jgi:hypothetical protein
MMHNFHRAQIEDVGRLKAPMRHIHFRHSLAGGGNRLFSLKSAKRASVDLSLIVPLIQIPFMAPKGAMEMEPMDVFYGTICLLLTRYP